MSDAVGVAVDAVATVSVTSRGRPRRHVPHHIHPLAHEYLLVRQPLQHEVDVDEGVHARRRRVLVLEREDARRCVVGFYARDKGVEESATSPWIHNKFC